MNDLNERLVGLKRLPAIYFDSDNRICLNTIDCDQPDDGGCDQGNRVPRGPAQRDGVIWTELS